MSITQVYPLINVRVVDEARGYVWDTLGLAWTPASQGGAGGGSLNVSAGTTSNNLTAITFANGNGVTFGLNASTITASIAAAGGAQTGISGIIASDATYTSGTVSFSNQNGVTIGSSVNGATQYVRLSVANQTVQTQSLIAAVYDGVNSISTGTIRFTNANGVSFSVNGQTLSGSVAAGATATGNLGALAAGTQTATSGTVVFSDSNGISFGMSGSTRVTASYTVPSTAGLLSAVNLSAGTTSSNLVSMVFSNSNSVSFGLNGATVTATVSYPAQTNQQMTMFATGNTTQSSTGTTNASSLIFRGEGLASIGITAGSIVISVPAGAPSPVNFSAGTTSNNLGSVVFSNSNGVSFGLNGSTITASVNAGGGGGVGAGVSNLGNTAGSTGTVTTGNVVFVGSGAMTLSQSTGAAGSAATITFLVPQTSSLSATGLVSLSTNGSTISIGVPRTYLSRYWNIDLIQGSTTQSCAQSTSLVVPFILAAPLSISYLRMPVTMSAASTTVGTAINTTWSHQQFYTFNAVVYSQGTGASSRSLQSVASGSVGMTQRFSVQAGANGSQYTVSYQYTYPFEGGTSSYSTSVGVSTSNLAISSQSQTVFTGMRFLDVPFANSLDKGAYWLAYGVSSTTSTQYSAGISAARLVWSNWAATQPNAAINKLGQATSSSNQFQPGLGSFTTNAIATTASLNLSHVSSSASHPMLLFQFVREA